MLDHAAAGRTVVAGGLMPTAEFVLTGGPVGLTGNELRLAFRDKQVLFFNYAFPLIFFFLLSAMLLRSTLSLTGMVARGSDSSARS